MSTRITPPALRGMLIGSLVGGLAVGGLAFAPPATAVSTDILVNEVYGGGGNAGATVRNDFIELVNRSSSPVSVAGWSVQYASSGGTSWQVTPLTGTIPAGGSYLVQQAAGTGGTTALPVPDATGSIPMSGSAGKVAVVRTATALTCGTGCAGNPDVVDLVGYGAATTGGEGTPTANLTNATSASRTAGPDTDVNAADFTIGTPTPQNSGGVPDPDPEPEPGGGPTCEGTDGVTIGSVQGAGPDTPVAGAAVTVRGTVVADLQDGGLDGFFVQDGGDGDPATSDGVFVYAPGGAQVDLGDAVTVRGTAEERFGQTQLGTVSYADCGTGTAPAPAALSLPAPEAAREAVEGMSVTVPTTLTVTDVFGLDTFGEVQLASGGRLLSPTEAAETGDPAAAVQAENATRSILVDDGRSTDLAAAGQAPPYLAPGDPVRVGDTAALQPVVLGYGFNAWRLQPADGSAEGTTFAPTNPRPAAPPAVGGDLRIADFNVLNYFVDFPSEFGDQARGAADAAELAQQQEKIVTAITALDADVITLHEIENSAVLTPATPYRAVETLLAAISARSGVDTWTYAPAAEDTDVITNAIVYRTDRVTAVGAPAVPADLSAFGNARSPIAQTFQAGGEVFTVVSNHLKSKGSGCGAGSDQPDPRGGNCNGDRVAQATALVAFAGQLATATGDPDVLLTGDFNAYRYEDPIDVVTAAGYTDMAPVLAPDQYSYVFRGGSGSLDHVLASATMAPKLTGLGVWDTNAVESRGYQYDGADALFAPDAFRASDHNPTLVGIDTDTPAQAVLDPAAPERGQQVTVIGTGFASGEQVVASLPDEPSANQRDVGSGVADVSGRVAITFTVPNANRKGEREVRLTGAGGEIASTSYTVR